MLDRIEFLFSEAMIALKRNTWMTFAALTNVAMALFLLGGLGYAYLQVNRYVNDLKASYQIRVFLNEDLTKKEQEEARRFTQNLNGVNVVRFVSKEEGLDRFSKQNPTIDISDLRIDNPLPNSFEVTVTDVGQVSQIVGDLKKQKWVAKDGVKNSTELQSFLRDSLIWVQIIGLGVAALMLATGGVLIYNTIRASVMARRREMRIMELVGASKFTILTPMVIEGVVQGLLGGFAAAALMAGTLWVLFRVVQALDAFARFSAPSFMSLLLWFGAAGAAYGLICSALALRERKEKKA